MTSIASAVLLTALAGTAWAQDEGDPCGGDPVEGAMGGDGEADAAPAPPEDADGAAMAGKPPLVLRKGGLAVNVALGINLSTDLVAKPIAIAPDVWYGLMPNLEVGVVHSNYGLTGFWFQPGGGICVTGEDNGCAKLYDGPIGLMANYLFMEGNLDLAANGGIVIGSLDPMALSLKAGVLGRWMSGKIMVTFNPAIGLGLTERDGGNKEEIMVPVTVAYAVSPQLHVGLQSGIFGPLDGFGDANFVPVGVGALYALNDNMMVGGSFNFVNLAGSGGGADFRTLDLFFSWRN